jgi:hypothetical protein
MIRFTVDDTTVGNGDLTYPVSLITIDEVAVAGGKLEQSNSSYYLYTGSSYWTVSASNFMARTRAGSLCIRMVICTHLCERLGQWCAQLSI